MTQLLNQLGSNCSWKTGGDLVPIYVSYDLVNDGTSLLTEKILFWLLKVGGM